MRGYLTKYVVKGGEIDIGGPGIDAQPSVTLLPAGRDWRPSAPRWGNPVVSPPRARDSVVRMCQRDGRPRPRDARHRGGKGRSGADGADADRRPRAASGATVERARSAGRCLTGEVCPHATPRSRTPPLIEHQGHHLVASFVLLLTLVPNREVTGRTVTQHAGRLHAGSVCVRPPRRQPPTAARAVRGHRGAAVVAVLPALFSPAMMKPCHFELACLQEQFRLAVK